MAFGGGSITVGLDDILSRTTEADIVSYYLGLKTIPSVISSPFRMDKTPSFGIYSTNGTSIHYVDFSTKERGGLFDLLMKLWGCKYPEALERVFKDLDKLPSNAKINHKDSSIPVKSTNTYSKMTELKCKTREWRDYDVEYWNSYGISLKWLKYAEVYPISHKIIVRDNKQYVFGTDKYAYAYVERKEGRVTLKIYQPFNKRGFKWCNKHDSSVISLWTKVPEYGERICICSSLKDALCLWANTGIPSIAVQGEGYSISETAIGELKRRYKHIFICFDNDEAGIKDGKKLSEATGFTNIILPKFEGGKDISDAYKVLGKENWKKFILPLFR